MLKVTKKSFLNKNPRIISKEYKTQIFYIKKLQLLIYC